MRSCRALAVLVSLALLATAAPGFGAPPVDDNPQLLSVVTDVRVLNLVNSLYLTPDQTRDLVPLIRENARELEALRAERVRMAPQYQAALENLRRELLANTGVSDEAKRLVREADATFKQMLEQHERNQAQRVERVKSILTENQVVLVAQFIPCIVPVRSLTNPERIGQANNNEGALRLLETVRRMPQPRYLRLREQTPQRAAERLVKYYQPAEMPAKVAEIQRTLDEARAMSDADFELHKAELAQRIGPPQKPAVKGKGLDARMAEYLLNPNLAPLLEQRLAQAPKG
jgi:Skp family chaperone for outer membrane proteins